VQVQEKKVGKITEVLYLSERYPNQAALEAEVDMWDSTVAGGYAWCPRKGQYQHLLGLTEREDALTLLTGIAMHAGSDVLHTSGDEALALSRVLEVFGDREPPPPGHSYAHLHAGLIEGVFKNYLVWRKKHENFTPLIVRLSDLDLTDVVAAVWRVLPDERVILGECKLVMRFEVDGEEFLYAMKPDLPALMGNRVGIVDVKVSCGGYLSEYWFEKHDLSNQLRGYCKGLTLLLQPLLARLGHAYVSQALVIGMYAGEKALETHTKAGKPSQITRFAPHGPLLFQPAHLEEAIWNQYTWRKIALWYQQFAQEHPKMHKLYGYAQNTGKACQGCSYRELCLAHPRGRLAKMQQKYVQRQRRFLDL
jgi:hypothetical protein